ncbi:MAG: mercury resistance system transport protein MerF [Geobacter sp.]|jgi:mercuric ion transport protein|nr:MAG: mercury resistance system transport protein MerF [Geobacter sp.]
MAEEKDKYKKTFIAAGVGTAVVAVCCFTPVLVLLLGIVGLSAFMPYLDYVLFPALVILMILGAVSYRKWKRFQK